MKITHKTLNNCPLCSANQTSALMGYRLNQPQGLFPERTYTKAQKVVCCNHCKLIYNDPLVYLDSEIFKEDDSLISYTHQEVEEIKRTETYTDVLLFLKHASKLTSNLRYLDIGSGIGRVAYVMKQNNFDVYSVEPKKELFHFAIQNGFTEEAKSFNVSFEDATFEKEYFDFVFLEPLHHLKDPNLAIQKALSWLKEGGYLHLETVNSRWLYKRALHLFYKITFSKIVPYTSALRKPFHVCEYSAETFKIYCKLNNLKLCNINSHPCNTFIKIKWMDNLMQKMMRRFHSGAEISVIIQKK